MSESGPPRTGEIKRTAGGWAIRYRDARGVRRQNGGFRTKREAKQVLDEELRKARLPPLYRPSATLQQLVEVFLDQYQGAPSSRERLHYYLDKATAIWGNEPIGELNALDVARWRANLPVTMRHGAHRALRQVLSAAVKWQWLDRNVARDVSNPLHERQEFQPFEDWDEVDALADELGRYGPLVIFSVGTGVRPEEALALDWQYVDLDAKAVAIHRAFAKGRLKTYNKTARSRRRCPCGRRSSKRSNSCPSARASCSRRPRAGASTSTTGAAASGYPRSRPRAWSTAASTTCATPSRRGASRPA